MSDDQDNHYARTHELLDASRTAVAGGEMEKALNFLIKAVEQSTLGWGSMDTTDDDDPHPEDPLTLPDLPTIMIQGSNCVSVLNEYAQKRDIAMPGYEFQGTGPFRCICDFLGRTTHSDQPQRTKNEAKHDAAVQMLQELREKPELAEGL